MSTAPAAAEAPLLTPDFLGRLEQLELVSRKMLAGRMKGDRLSKRKGRGAEFADYRPYTVGDVLDKDGYEDGLRFLAARSLDVYAVQVLSQEEIEPPYTGDLKLTDVEDGDEAEVTISAPLLARYRQTLTAFRSALSGFCT